MVADGTSEQKVRIISYQPPHMSNTPDLSRVVFTCIRIESDRHRNWKWVQGALSVILEVRDLQERVGLRMLVNGLDRI